VKKTQEKKLQLSYGESKAGWRKELRESTKGEEEEKEDKGLYFWVSRVCVCYVIVGS
jgi:hypothetical protein